MLLKLQTAHSGHLEIDDQALGKAMRQCRKKILSRFECLYTESARPKQPTQSLEHGRIIVNYGNPGGSFRHERLWRRNWSSVELTVGPIRPDFYFEIWALSAMRTRSATVRRPSFSIIRLRWTLMVFSTVPRSPAICLLSRPARTWVNTCRSRGVKTANLALIEFISALALRVAASCFSARAIAASSSASLTGLVRKSIAPALMARTLVGMSPLPVRKMTGCCDPPAVKACCSSSPSSPG